HGDGSAGGLTDDPTLVLRFRLALLLPALAEDAPAGGGRPGRSRADRVRRGAVRAWRTGPGRDSAQARVHLPPGAVAGAARGGAAVVPAGASVQSVAGT